MLQAPSLKVSINKHMLQAPSLKASKRIVVRCRTLLINNESVTTMKPSCPRGAADIINARAHIVRLRMYVRSTCMRGHSHGPIFPGPKEWNIYTCLTVRERCMRCWQNMPSISSPTVINRNHVGSSVIRETHKKCTTLFPTLAIVKLSGYCQTFMVAERWLRITFQLAEILPPGVRERPRYRRC